MINNRDYILSHILNCGFADLEILTCMKYDFFDIIDELKDKNNLSLSAIVEHVFYNIVNEFKTKADLKKETIISELKEYIEMLPSEEDTNEEIDCKLDKMNNNAIGLYLDNKYNIEWREEAEKHLENIKNLNPVEDIDFYFNYLDTHITIINYPETYKKFFADDLKDVEDLTGLNVEG